MDDFVRRPKGVELGPLSLRVFETLCMYTAFPWPLLETQAKRAGCDPANLGHPGLERLIEPLARGVARFNSPEAGREAQLALERLLYQPNQP